MFNLNMGVFKIYPLAVLYLAVVAMARYMQFVVKTKNMEGTGVLKI
jgi:hypothetical protein